MSIASEERINEVVNYVEANLDKTPEQIAVDQDFSSPDTVRRYLQDGGRMDLWSKLRKAEDPSFEGVKESPQELVQEELRKRSSGDNPKPTSYSDDEKIKLAFGDLHLADEDVMWRSIKSTIRNVIAYLSDKDYKYLEVLNAGDTVSGTSIYRGQEARNLTNKPHWQTLGAALYQKDLFDQLLDETSIEDYEVRVVKGNHDQAGSSRGTNLAYYMVRDMQSLDIPTSYEGEHYVSDDIYVVHGFGGSDYRPQSPQFLRSLQKRLHNVNKRNDTDLNRILHGHTHWADDNFQYTISVAFDCLGGFQRNKRAELAKLQRPAGFMLYEYEEKLWESEPRWHPTLIQPDNDIFWEEAEQTDLEFQNVRRIGELLQRAYEVSEMIEKSRQPTLQ